MATQLEGFDLVIELDRSTLSALLDSNPLARSFQPPFERTFDIAGGTPSTPVRAHFVFTRRELFLRAPNSIELKLSFERSSVIGHPDIRRTLGGADLTRLSGTVSLFVPVNLEAGRDPAARELVLDLRTSSAMVQFEPPRAGDPSGRAGPLLLVRGAMIDAIQREVHAMAGTEVRPNNPRVPLPLRVDPATTSSLSPIVLASARLAIFAPEDPTRQSLALFGSMQPMPPAITRTESRVLPGRNFTFALSPRAFHRLLFGPAMQGMFLVARLDMMPPMLGEAESVAYPDLPHWSITQIEDALNERAVDVHVEARYVTGEGLFTSAQHIGLRGHLTFSVVDGRIAPRWDTDGTGASGGATFGLGWWLSAAFGPLATMGIAVAVVGFSAAAFGGLLAPSLPAVDTPPLGLPGSRLASVDVHRDQFAISGTVPAPTAPYFAFRATIGTAVDHLKGTPIEGGTYTSTGCPEGDFTWRGQHRMQRFTFTPSAVFGSEPVQFAWRISGFNSTPRLPVDLGQGFMRISAETSHPDPPPGSREVRRDIEIETEVLPDGRMIITAGPEHGNYRLDIECTATDADGNRSVALGYVMVQTRLIEFDAPWAARMAECARMFAQAGAAAGYGWDDQGPPGRGDDRKLAISPAGLTAFVFGAALPGNEATLRNIELTFGSVLNRGFSADANPTAPELALAKLQELSKKAPERNDASQNAVDLVNAVTGQQKARGEDLLGDPKLKKLLPDAKAKKAARKKKRQ